MYGASKAIKKFGSGGGENVSPRILNRLGVSGYPKLLTREMGPITTSVQRPEFQRSLPLPEPEFQRSFPLPARQIEQSPIIFGQPSSITKTITPRKFGINPFTGKMKATKIPSSYKASLKRILEKE